MALLLNDFSARKKQQIKGEDFYLRKYISNISFLSTNGNLSSNIVCVVILRSKQQTLVSDRWPLCTYPVSIDLPNPGTAISAIFYMQCSPIAGDESIGKHSITVWLIIPWRCKQKITLVH